MQKLISNASKCTGSIAAIWPLTHNPSDLPETNWKKGWHFSVMAVVQTRSLTSAVKLNFYQSNHYWFWHFPSNLLTRGKAWWHPMIKKSVLIINSQIYCHSVCRSGKNQSRAFFLKITMQVVSTSDCMNWLSFIFIPLIFNI